MAHCLLPFFLSCTLLLKNLYHSRGQTLFCLELVMYHHSRHTFRSVPEGPHGRERVSGHNGPPMCVLRTEMTQKVQSNEC